MRVALAASLALVCACSRPAANLVADSDMQHVDAYWEMQGRAKLLPGLGPDGHSMIYIRGEGGPSGFRSSAAFFSRVVPGRTYTFSAYVDSTGHRGAPPYVTLGAVNGTWAGASVYQPGKGRVSTTFSVPASCGTTLVKGTFSSENGEYPVGRGAQLSEPQIEIGDIAHDYVAGDGGDLGRQAPGGNLVVDSDLRNVERYWEFTGRIRVKHAENGSGVAGVNFEGDGRQSGFNNTASFFAIVEPGKTYTFSIFMDALARDARPAYAFLTPVDGTWRGTALYQYGRGRAFATFTIPQGSGTTQIRATVSPQNGTYPAGSHFFAAQPQLAATDIPGAYESGSDELVKPPPGGNLVIDSDMENTGSTWQLAGRMRVETDADHGRAIAYVGNGQPSGFSNLAKFFARVTPGGTYTFSSYVDGSAHAGTPPYVFLSAVDGNWPGAYVYQPGWGRIYLTFTIPRDSGTTCIAGTVSPQNGTYGKGEQMVFFEPQIAAGPIFTKYVAGHNATGGCG
jgi:hypothetical protein